MQLAHISDRYYGTHMDGSMGLVGLLFWLLVLGAMIGLIIYVVRSLSSQPPSQAQTRDPLDYARERYAKGEITKAELADIKKELSSTK